MIQFRAWLVDKPECSRDYTIAGSAATKEYLAKLWKRMVKLERETHDGDILPGKMRKRGGEEAGRKCKQKGEPANTNKIVDRQELISRSCKYVHSVCKGVNFSLNSLAAQECSRIKSQQVLDPPAKLFVGTDLDSACRYILEVLYGL
jgi:hypothetical protein